VKSSRKFLKLAFAAAVLAALTAPTSSWACAACAGRSDSELAQGLNWGIFTLFIVLMGVLGSFLTFFIYLIRKETAAMKQAAALTSAKPAQV